MTVTVSPLRSEDLPFLWEMCAVAAYVPEVTAQSAPGLARYVNDWGRPDDTAFTAWDADSGARAGVIWMRLFPSSDPGYGYYDEHTPEMGLGVAEAYRGGGVGRQLLMALVDAARGRYPGITLSVFEWNHAAIRLYQSAGFAKFAEYPNSQGDSSWRMRVAFGPPSTATPA